MNYNTAQFWVLFAIILAFYWRNGHRAQNRILLVGSYVFYGFWDYRFLCLVLLSTIIDFIGGLGVAGRKIPARSLAGLFGLLLASALIVSIPFDRLSEALASGNLEAALRALPTTIDQLTIPILVGAGVIGYLVILPILYSLSDRYRRFSFLWISMVANLAILGFFKYFDFFIDSARQLAMTMGLGDPGWNVLGILLPAGISFYTFQAMSYTVDIYRNECEPTDDFPDFALFVCFFPHLVAGPIMRAHTLLPQVINPRRFTYVQFVDGFYLIAIGMLKKVVLADNLAPIADNMFNAFADHQAEHVNFAEVLVGVYAFAWQIYGDFAGYSAVARGVSKWLGFELVINFDQPYFATSPSDFWQRWHISLSTWLRDYLYIPLGGNRCGSLRNYSNLMTTMVLGGLWHGASWTFVAWGVYHGAILCLFRALRFRDPKLSGSMDEKLRWLMCVLLMFHMTCFGWLLFRADSFQSVLSMIGTVFRSDAFIMTPFAIGALILTAFYSCPIMLLDAFTSGERQLRRVTDANVFVQFVVYAYIFIMILCFQAEKPGAFIYFQF